MKLRFISFVLVLLGATAAFAEEGESAYRTDQNPDEALPWYQPVRGEFPPEDSAHYFAGELIQMDHLERTFILRADRDDAQARNNFDRPISVSMLPYTAVYYHNAPARLRDIPVGTHLHGFYFHRPDDEENQWPPKRGESNRISTKIDFTRCMRLEDDFSYHARRNQIWKITEVDREEMEMTAQLLKDGEPEGEPQIFELLNSARVFRGNGFGSLEDIKKGQEAQFNLTWATIYGPGRIRQIWLDEESRTVAAALQNETNNDHIRQRGIAGWVDAVDDKEQIVTMTFFEGIDPALFEDLKISVEDPLGWPTSREPDDPLAPKGTIAVARDCLMTYDPVNDRKGGTIVETNEVPKVPGSSGVQISVQCGMLLEGFRPGGIVRFYPAAWKVIALPLEETYHGRE